MLGPDSYLENGRIFGGLLPNIVFCVVPGSMLDVGDVCTPIFEQLFTLDRTFGVVFSFILLCQILFFKGARAAVLPRLFHVCSTS